MKLVYLLILMFACSLLFFGLATKPRFNDGLIHLQVARQYAEEHRRPVYSKLTVDAQEERERYIGSESPMWYISVGYLASVVGDGGWDDFHVASQCFQAIVYVLLLLVAFLLFRERSSLRTALFAVVIIATMPLFVVGGILCYLDLLATLFTVLCVYYIDRKKWLLFILSTAGLWYAKRTGMMLVPLFIIAFVVVYMQGHVRSVSRWLRLVLYGLFLVVVISPDLFYRIVNLSADMIICRAILPGDDAGAAREITAYSAPSSLPIPAFFQWMGGVCAALPIMMVLAMGKGQLKLNYGVMLERHVWVPLFIVFGYVLLWLAIPLARDNVRYLMVIMPIIVYVSVSIFEGFDKRVCSVVGILLCMQFFCVLWFVNQQRQINAASKEVLCYLDNHTAQNSIVIWDESELGRWYLRRKIYGRYEGLYHRICTASDPVQVVKSAGVDCIVVSKRFLYEPEQGTFCDMGMPRKGYDLIREFFPHGIVIDNSEYCVIRISAERKSKEAVDS